MTSVVRRLRARLPIGRRFRSRTPAPERRPRIVVASRVFTPEPIPAAFRLEQLARALDTEGADVRVLTTRSAAGTAVPPSRLDVRRAPVKRDAAGQVRGYLSYLSFDLPLALRLLCTRRLRAVVVEPPPTTGLVVMAVCALRRIPYVFYAADVWADATESVEAPRIVKALVRAAEVLVWRRARTVLAISTGVADRIRELRGCRAHVTMIGNGIDTDVFTPDGPVAESEQGAPTGPYAVYAGTVSEWQGARVFVDAFDAVRIRYPQARLIFFSEGSGRAEIERHVRDHGLEGIEFHDRIPPHTTASWLRGAVCGLSSIKPGLGYEFALPTKIYAATACGTPVVHTGTGAAAQRIRENRLGWAADYDPAAVAEALLAAFSGADRPGRDHLRRWTVENASLRTAALRGARAVLRAAGCSA